MRIALALASCAALCGCGGSIAPASDQPSLTDAATTDASTGVVYDAGSPEVAVALDAAALDASDGGPCSTCDRAGGEYCVLWLAPDAGAWNPEHPFAGGGIASWNCGQGPVGCEPTEAGAPECGACGLSPTLGVGYSAYDNRPWIVGCMTCSGDADCPQGAACGYLAYDGCSAPAECIAGEAFGASCNDGSETPACTCDGTEVFLGCGQMASTQPIASVGQGCGGDP
jgi:hypothetical protein